MMPSVIGRSFLYRLLKSIENKGDVLDTLGWFSLAGYYHELSRRFTGPSTDDLTLASACVCRAIHLDYTGQWDQALEQYETAAKLYEKIGHIKKWGSPISLMIFICNHRGEFDKSREYAQKLIQIGVESGDQQRNPSRLKKRSHCVRSKNMRNSPCAMAVGLNAGCQRHAG
ncbi:MAG: hypothetical protein LC657_12260 [Desulfobacteraceae bacterium]|nr:hypothetical protein [Desulfobacteraceae bacterium]